MTIVKHRLNFMMIFFILNLFGPGFGLRRLSESEKKENASNKNDTLISVQVFFRHGDRSPLFDFAKNSINVTANFPLGLGQLTQKGKQHSYQFGQLLRKKYASFLSDKFHPNYTYAISSDYDRTIQTAQAVMCGLHSSGINKWDSIPIRTIPYKIDNIMAFSADCPRYLEELDCHRYHGIGHELDSNYTEFYEYVANHTGIPFDTINFEVIGDLFDTLFVQDLNGFGLPNWARQFPNSTKGEEHYLMRKLAEHTFSALTYNDITMRLRGGPLMNEIFRNIDAHIYGNETNPLYKYKMRLYSGHDSTIAALLQVLTIYNYKIVQYNGAVIIELYRRRDFSPEEKNQKDCSILKNHYIKVLYRNCTTSNFAYEMPLPECKDPMLDQHGCSIYTLKRVKSHFLNVNWKQECKSRILGCAQCNSYKNEKRKKQDNTDTDTEDEGEQKY